MKITDEAVEAAADAFDDTYEAHLNIGAAHWTDNRKVALRAALEAAAPLIVAQHEREAWRPITEAPRDGTFWCWCPDAPPQTYKEQILRVRDGDWLTSWPPAHFRPLSSPPASEKERADG